MIANRQRILSLDLIRLLACMMVVAMHSPMPSKMANGMFLAPLSYITAPCIGLFFMVSGALLLPVSDNDFYFIKKRFAKIAFPTLFWTCIYLICSVLIGEMDGGKYNLIQLICSIPFSSTGNGVLWFMYALSGLYLLAPVISPWLEKATEKEIRMYLLLWAVTLCYPILSLWLKIDEGIGGILYYFTGYAGYFLLGYYMRRYGQKIKLRIALIGFILAWVVLAVAKSRNWDVDFYDMFWYLSIFVALMCVFWWKVITVVADKIHSFQPVVNIIVLISNLSFGIYLIHIFVMRYLLWRCDYIKSVMPYPLQTFVVLVLTVLISIALCWFISFLPKSDWIIGFHHKRSIK